MENKEGYLPSKVRVISRPISAYLTLYAVVAPEFGQKKFVRLDGVVRCVDKVHLLVFDGLPWRFNVKHSDLGVVFDNNKQGAYTFAEIDSDDYLPAEVKETATDKLREYPDRDFILVDGKFIWLTKIEEDTP